MRELGDEWERGRWRPPSLATAAGKVKSLASVRWRARNTGRVDIGDSSDGGSCDWRREERRRPTTTRLLQATATEDDDGRAKTTRYRRRRLGHGRYAHERATATNRRGSEYNTGKRRGRRVRRVRSVGSGAR